MLSVIAFAVLLKAQGVGPAGNRTLVWSAEFGGNALPNPNDWSDGKDFLAQTPHQVYTDKVKKNAQVEDGKLVITAINGGDHYTTAALMSTRSWLYGYFEVRAKIPTGKGTLPQIWFVGDALREQGADHIGWPRCGEMDLMEYAGFMPHKIYCHIHTESATDTGPTNIGQTVFSPTAYSQYHVYGLNWTPTEIDFYFDGAKVMTYTKDPLNTNSWPFDKPQFLIMNLAIGGKWGGRMGVDPAAFPAQLIVDYVHVYQ